MTKQNPQYPPDEPIIGAPSSPFPPRPAPSQAAQYIGAPAVYADEDRDDEGWDDGEYDYDEDDGYYEDDYYEGAPARQPMFYVFIGMAVLLGVAFVALLFSLVQRGNDEDDPGVAAAFDVGISQPLNNDTSSTGKEVDVVAFASSNEAIVRFDLFVDDQPVAEAQPGPPDGTLYRATLKWQFNRAGTHKLFVRVISASGATADSSKVSLRVVEPIGDKPTLIRGKAVTTTNVRIGPGEQFESIGRVNDGDEVRILARNRTTDWLYIEFQSGGWVKRAAIEAEESLEFLPIKDVTPTPVPATNTPQPSATPATSPSPTVGASAPDFAPTGAVLIDGGTRLRLTVANLSPNNYNGPLVVSVGGVAATTLEQVFPANLVANGSTTVDFELNPPVTTQKTAAIKVDPQNAVKEANEDNNNASISLSPPVQAPDIVIVSAEVGPSGVTVTIRNQGGAMPSSKVTVKVTVGGSAAESSQTIALAKDQTAPPFTVAKPGSGQGQVTVLINDQPAASAAITLP